MPMHLSDNLLLPLLAMLGASLSMASSNLAMRWVTGHGGQPLRVLQRLFLGALAPLVVLGVLGHHAPPPLALLLGATAGISALLATASALVAMRASKVGPVLLFLNMAAGVPVVLALLMRWDSAPTWQKYLGLALAATALVLCSGAGARITPGRWVVWAIAAFLLNGLNQCCQKLLAVLHLKTEMLGFNLAYFAGGLVVAWGVERLLRGDSPDPAACRREWGVGLGFGLLIAAQMFWILYAVQALPAAVAFPTLGILPLVLATLAAGPLFHERLAPREIAGLLLACASLVLLNVG
jgi:drug/metabolite transporter (DMT)-like permease